jgi:hypothetical protein
MTPAEFFASGIRAPPQAIRSLPHVTTVRVIQAPALRSCYTLRRQRGPPLYLTVEALACFYDLTIRQAGWALQACDTAIKRLRLWAREDTWPCKEVRLRSHPVHTLESVREARLRLLEATREAQPELCAALARAEELCRPPQLEAAVSSPSEIPASWLDGLDAAVSAAIADEPAQGPSEDGGLGLFAANAFEIAPDDPFWAEFCQ